MMQIEVLGTKLARAVAKGAIYSACLAWAAQCNANPILHAYMSIRGGY